MAIQQQAKYHRQTPAQEQKSLLHLAVLSERLRQLATLALNNYRVPSFEPPKAGTYTISGYG